MYDPAMQGKSKKKNGGFYMKKVLTLTGAAITAVISKPTGYKKISLIGLLTMSLFAVQAADWYVSIETGKNKNAGTREAPLKNIWKAVEKASAGDNIYVAAGNYSGKMSCGWIDVNKGVSLIGGYASDFSSRDIIKYPTTLRPTNAMNATKPASDAGTMRIKTTGADQKVLLDGFYFDQGDANSYHASKGKPEAVATGMWLQPPAKGNTQYPSIDRYSLYASTDGDLTIQNCVFLNGSNYAVNVAHFSGKVKILNNLFVNNRMVACNVTSRNAKPFVVDFEFANNTVLYTWSRTSEMSDMGYGVRANTKVATNVHHNIIGLNVGTGFDNTLGNPKDKKIKLDHNIFFLNKKSDVTATISPNIAFFKVTDDAFEDYADYDGIESLEGNIALDKADAFKGVLDLPYLDAFLSATYSETTDYDENSPANTLRSVLGLNKQGTITTKVSMFCNRYPADNVLKLFGIIKDYGAQLPGAVQAAETPVN